MYYISDTNKFIYYYIPKNASSTLKGEFSKSIYNTYHYKDNIQNKKDYIKIVFLRNPIDRFLSGYYETHLRYYGFKCWHKEGNLNCKNKLNFLDTYTEDKYSLLREFLNFIKEKGFFDEHIKPQYYFFKEEEIDNFYFIEDINNDLEKFRKKIKITSDAKELPTIRTRKKKIAKCLQKYCIYKDEIPEDIIETIKEIYSEDIRIYKKYKKF